MRAKKKSIQKAEVFREFFVRYTALSVVFLVGWTSIFFWAGERAVSDDSVYFPMLLSLIIFALTTAVVFFPKQYARLQALGLTYSEWTNLLYTKPVPAMRKLLYHEVRK